MVEVITHGAGEALWHTFNAMALLFQKQGVMANVLYISFNFALIVAVTQMVLTQDAVKAFQWAVAFVFVINALMLPKMSVMILDRASLYQRKVDHVPFILGFSAAFSSGLGDFLAQKFDEVFAPVGLSYSKTGVAMSSKLITRLSRISFPHPDAALNLRTFVQQCLVPDVARGKYTLQELVQSHDLWAFLEKNASPIRSMPYHENVLNVSQKIPSLLTCRQVALKEAKNWPAYIHLTSHHYGRLFFPDHPAPHQLLLEQLPVSYEYLTSLSQEAATLLRQNLMRNLIRDGLIELNAVHGTTGVIQAYAVARAEEQQKRAYALHGETASLSLSTLKVLFEVLVYSLFPLAASMALFPGGLRILKEYLIMMFSIQAWAPMYAILNMLLNVTAKSKSVAAVSVAGLSAAQKVLSFATIPRLGEANEWISAMAGYGMSLIPFLSYGIFRYGAGALTQISSHFGSIAQSAFSHAAEEATTGNLGIGNTNFANHSRENMNAFKYDTNLSVASGKASLQETDGATTAFMAGGGMVINRDSAFSKLGATLNVSESLQANLSRGAELSYRSGMQQTEQATDSRLAALNQFMEARENRALDVNSGETFSTHHSVLEDSGLSKNSRIAEDIEKRFGISKELAGRIVAGMKTEASGGINFGMAKASVSAYLEATGSYTNANLEALNNAIKYAYDEGVSENWRQAETEAKEDRYAVLNAENHSFGENISASLNESIVHQKGAMASFSEEAAYRESAQMISHKSAQFNQDMSQAFFNSLVQQHGLEGAKKIISDPDLMQKQANSWINVRGEALKESIKAKGLLDNPDAIQQRYQQNRDEINAIDNPDDSFEYYQTIVNTHQDQRLREPINTAVKIKVEQKTMMVEKKIEEGKVVIKDQEQKLKTEGQAFQKEKRVNQDLGPYQGKNIYDIVD